MNSGVAVITGGEGDLARAIHAQLQSRGWTVHAPGKAELDVTRSNSVSAWFSRIDQLDLLIQNAGVIDDALLVQQTEPEWSQVQAVNLDGAFRCARAALPLMARQQRGHIVHIGSFAAMHGTVGQAAYAAAKAGLIALTQSIASEHGADNVRCNCVLPGFLDTKMTQPALQQHRDRIVAQHTLGRLNTVADAARFIVQLDSFPHISGQVFQLDSRLRRQL
jgi:NAD(P)-dependent dehydrogenase (short-subunit alcohol dehydrogenase family)